MAKREAEQITETGWTDWIHPKGDENGVYQLQCCDCGLVHEMQFAVARDGKPIDNVYTTFITVKDKKLKTIFRARRNNRMTAQTRRRKREKNELT
jgi:nitrate/TMAO reductase-like tetraheme cytochrome c subunit